VRRLDDAGEQLAVHRDAGKLDDWHEEAAAARRPSPFLGRVSR